MKAAIRAHRRHGCRWRGGRGRMHQAGGCGLICSKTVCASASLRSETGVEQKRVRERTPRPPGAPGETSNACVVLSRTVRWHAPARRVGKGLATYNDLFPGDGNCKRQFSRLDAARIAPRSLRSGDASAKSRNRFNFRISNGCGHIRRLEAICNDLRATPSWERSWSNSAM